MRKVTQGVGGGVLRCAPICLLLVACGSSAHSGAASPSGGSAGSSNGGGGTDGLMPPPHTVGSCDALPAAGTWESITPPGYIGAGPITVDPFDDGTLWFGEGPSGVAAGAPKVGGLFKSTDCGATWTHVNTGTNGAAVDQANNWSMAIDPVQKGVIYVIGAYGPQGLWKSTNGGVDWVQLFPPDSEFAKTVQYNFVGSVTMDPTNHLHLVVGTHGDCAAPYAPVCQAETTDGGATWKMEKIPNPTGAWAEQTGPYILNATTILFAALSNGLFVTTDNAKTWKDVSPAGVKGVTGGEYTHKPLTKASDGNYYLPAISGGVVTSKDGLSWSLIPNSGNGYQLGFVAGGGKLYSGDYAGGGYQSASLSDPTTWTSYPAPPPLVGKGPGPVFLDYDESHHVLYSSNFQGGLWRVVTD